jgi:hypothetical protein
MIQQNILNTNTMKKFYFYYIVYFFQLFKISWNSRFFLYNLGIAGDTRSILAVNIAADLRF